MNVVLTEADLQNPNLNLEGMEEDNLVKVATFHVEDEIANKAIKILRENFDSTYFFCTDCDGLVTTFKNCCLNRKVCDEKLIIDLI